MAEETLVFSVVSKGEGPQPEQELLAKLERMAGVTQVSMSAREGRISITGDPLHPEVFSWAIQQSGYDVLDGPK